MSINHLCSQTPSTRIVAISPDTSGLGSHGWADTSQKRLGTADFSRCVWAGAPSGTTRITQESENHSASTFLKTLSFSVPEWLELRETVSRSQHLLYGRLKKMRLTRPPPPMTQEILWVSAAGYFPPLKGPKPRPSN